MRREGAEQIAADRLEPLVRERVVARRSLELGDQLGRAGAAALDVLAVGLGPHVAQEGQEALCDARRLELIAQDRRQREGDRRVVAREHVEQREVRGGHGLPQPLLAERPCPEALHVGHVRVEDERELWSVAAGRHGRQTATKSSARWSRAGRPARSEKSRTEIAGMNRE